MHLLVSVVSPQEARTALAGGAHIIDVKNPAEGALGAPEPAILRAVREVLPSSVPLSVALGDAPHLPGTVGLAARGAASCGAEYVKVGLLGSSQTHQAIELLRAVRRAAEEVNPGVRIVGVAYADAGRAGGLPPGELPAVAAAAGVEGVLLDTFFKDGVSTFDALEQEEIEGFLTAARAAGLSAGLAGSLQPSDFGRAAQLGADIIGVRGAACDGGRNGSVSADRVRELSRTLAGIRERLSREAPTIAQRVAPEKLITAGVGEGGGAGAGTAGARRARAPVSGAMGPGPAGWGAPEKHRTAGAGSGSGANHVSEAGERRPVSGVMGRGAPRGGAPW